MDRTIISWNWPNFITITLMAMLGWLVVGVICQTVKRYSDNVQKAAA